MPERPKRNPTSRPRWPLIVALAVAAAFSVPTFYHCWHLFENPPLISGVLWVAIGIGWTLNLVGSSHVLRIPMRSKWYRTTEPIAFWFACILVAMAVIYRSTGLAVSGFALTYCWILLAIETTPAGRRPWTLLLVGAVVPLASPLATTWTAIEQSAINLGSQILDHQAIWHVVLDGQVRFADSGLQQPLVARSFVSEYALLGLLVLILNGYRFRWIQWLLAGAIASPLLLLAPAVRMLVSAVLLSPADGTAISESTIDLYIVAVNAIVFGCAWFPLRMFITPIKGDKVPFRENHAARRWNRWTLSYDDLANAQNGAERFAEVSNSGVKSLASGAYRFVCNYWSMLSWRHGLAILALLMIAGGSAVFLQMRDRTVKRQLSRYEVEFLDAVVAKQFDRAAVLARRIELMSDSILNSQKLVHALFQNGLDQQAMVHVKRLVQDPRGTSPLVHLWYAQHLAKEMSTSGQADLHFRRAIGGMKDKQVGLEAYLRFLVSRGRKPEAKEVVRQLKRLDPAYRLAASMEAFLRGDPKAAMHEVRLAEAILEDLLKHANEQRVRRQLVQAYVSQRKFQAATTLIKQADQWENDALLKQILVTCNVIWCEFLLDDEEKLLSLVNESLSLQPTHQLLLNFLARQSYNRHWPQDAAFLKLASSTLSEAVHDKETPASVLLIMGTGEARDGNLGRAEHLLRMSIARTPKNADALNNLAWTIFQSDPLRGDEALQLVDQAISLRPESKHALTTRAEIHMSMHNDLLAINDLETALKYGERTQQVYQSLSELYRRQGDSSTAAQYQRFAGAAKK